MDDARPPDSPVTLPEKITAEFEKAVRDSVARTSASLLEPIHKVVNTALHDIPKTSAAWRLETQEIVSTFERFVATTQEVAARIADVMAEASRQFNEVLKRSDHVAKLGWTLYPNHPLPDALHLSKLTTRPDADAYMLKWYVPA